MIGCPHGALLRESGAQQGITSDSSDSRTSRIGSKCRDGARSSPRRGESGMTASTGTGRALLAGCCDCTALTRSIDKSRLCANSNDGTLRSRMAPRPASSSNAEGQSKCSGGLGRRASNAVIPLSALVRYRDMVSKFQPMAGNQLSRAGDLT
jgi:hypothetical protein